MTATILVEKNFIQRIRHDSTDAQEGSTGFVRRIGRDFRTFGEARFSGARLAASARIAELPASLLRTRRKKTTGGYNERTRKGAAAGGGGGGGTKRHIEEELVQTA
ncbi:hypothetical protein K0M31_019872 [Melipona bicolor]|uniref:Uncharacterized protein n=1 Tax=Melipona bicolor TaxID=60889 RepID=A0AA40G0A6_9HYME|nr:hypothetical protein K0M31_019872 [Melipona bicolor]